MQRFACFFYSIMFLSQKGELFEILDFTVRLRPSRCKKWSATSWLIYSRNNRKNLFRPPYRRQVSYLCVCVKRLDIRLLNESTDVHNTAEPPTPRATLSRFRVSDKRDGVKFHVYYQIYIENTGCKTRRSVRYVSEMGSLFSTLLFLYGRRNQH